MPEPFELDLEEASMVVFPEEPDMWDHNVYELEYAASQSYNRSLKPVDGEVRWYMDQFGRVWAEVYVEYGSGTLARAVPADRVVIVKYKREEDEVG